MFANCTVCTVGAAAVVVWNAKGRLLLPVGEGAVGEGAVGEGAVGEGAVGESAVGAVEVVLGFAGTSARQAHTGDTEYDMDG